MYIAYFVVSGSGSTDLRVRRWTSTSCSYLNTQQPVTIQGVLPEIGESVAMFFNSDS